jgi:hypothetical protein
MIYESRDQMSFWNPAASRRGYQLLFYYANVLVWKFPISQSKLYCLMPMMSMIQAIAYMLDAYDLRYCVDPYDVLAT